MWPADLVSRLRAAPDFEAASTAFLSGLAGPELELPPALRLVRGLVHRRTALGYDGLVPYRYGRETTGAPTGLGQTRWAWRWVGATQDTVLLDVAARTATLAHLDGPPQELAEGDAISDQSALQLVEATHVIAVPLRGVDASLGGVVSLELRVTGAAGPRREDWRRLLAEVAARVDVAGPYLLSKPLPPPASTLADAHLPVVGQRLGPSLTTLERLARFGDTILLRGPPGAGKTCLARWVHARSPASHGPFETLQIQNLPDELVPGELFGWRKNAHSEARADKKGLIELARGGTLLIDEIGALSWTTQGRLLQLLDTGRYRPLGDTGPERHAHVRFVLATNEDLEGAVRERRFRPDLYERVAGASFTLRPLAERADEIPAWAAIFAARRAATLGRSIELAPEVGPLLASQPWPGNLRQLDQVITNAIALAEGQGVLGVDHVREALDLRGAPPRGPLAELLAEAGRALARLAAHADPPLRLDQLDVLRAYTLAGAVEDADSVKDAFLRFGEHGLVQSRNYNQTWHHEQRRRADFEALLEALSCSQHETDRVPNTKGRSVVTPKRR